MAMKLQNNVFLLKLSTVIKILALVLISFGSFYLGKQWSQSDGSQSLRRFPFHPDHDSESVSIFQSLNGFFNPSSSELNDNVSNSFHPLEDEEREEAFFDSIYTAAPEGKLVVKKMGVLDENGVMKEDFDVGDFDPSVVEGFEERNDERMAAKKVEVKKFGMCLNSMREYIPCLDNLEAINKSNSTDKNEVFERHCPGPGFGLNCLIPAPKGYKSPIPWPNSRDEIWFNNVPHTWLIEDKGGKNWITISGDKFKFPGGHGADQYLDQIEKMAPEIAFGKHVRVVLDIGCGIASFGAYLFSRNVLTLSVAPKGVHDNQIQFALERGVPAMVTPFATRRLPYPSQAFDLIHSSRFQINWTRDDGVLLLEVNRLLRAGGYFVWAPQPVYKHELLLEKHLEVMVNLTSRLCWNLVKKEGYIAIWQKPLNNVCYLSRKEGTQPPLCEPYDDPDKVWYVDMKSCITRLPEEGLRSNVTIWPARLQSPPDRLQSLQLDAYISRKELFKADKKFWDEIVEGYIRIMGWKSDKFRNVLDMRAGYGGFAAALIENDVDCWVLNVVPVSGPNTLPIIYDRGLIGVMHDWCEPFDTFPRTYDLLHAAGLFSVERKRCKIASIMLEMDRILRPGGRVYIRDTVAVVDEVEATGKAMGWHVTVRDTEDGPRSSYRILVCNKLLHIQ